MKQDDNDSTDVTGWLAAAILASLLFVLPLPENFIEQFYSRQLYPWWQAEVTSVSNLVPFALLDALILAVVTLVGWRIVRLAGRVRKDGVGAAVWEGVRRLVRAAAVLAIVFVAAWGLNYRRKSLEDTVPPAHPTVDDLRGVLADAGALGARLRPAPAGDYPSFEAVTAWLGPPLNEALAVVHRPPLGTRGTPKYSLILTPFFTAAGVDGMVDPFALESIVHPDLLPNERPFAVAHEWAHLSGAADEAEASALGWLACMHGGKEMAYSATLYLIMEIGGALPANVWRDASAKLDPGIRADLNSIHERLARSRPRVQRTAFRVYDSYLRANHVEDGVASYSRALSLILSPLFREALNDYRADRDPRP